jgi:small GTP-binding protein
MDKTVDKFNIMVIGDEEVGKTTILERYFNRKFNSERKKTIGVEYYLKNYTKQETGLVYNLKFWDTAGQEKFHSITKNYYQRAHGMLITMAINKRSSFSNLKMWINSIVEGSSSNDLPLVVLCNKCDLEEEREVENSEIERFCQDEKLTFFFTSAKNGKNIDNAFEYITNEVIKKNSGKNKDDTLNLRDDVDDTAVKSKCC